MRLLAPPLVCRAAVELVSDYLEGALSRRDRRRLERHLAGCDGCESYLDQVRAVIAACGRVEPDDLGADVLEGLVGIYRQFRHDQETS
ncbi:MAG: zf-HC2 domain-containing protein [Acidimicrobiales bacterium]